MRLMDRRGEIWGTMTPLMGLTWVYDDIYMNSRSDSEVWYITMSWQDNPFLNPEEIRLMESVLPDSELESMAVRPFPCFRRYGVS